MTSTSGGSGPVDPLAPGALDVIVVMPVYNEADLIVGTLNSWVDALSDLSEPWQILVIDDGSTDNTASLIDSVAQRRRGIEVIHQQNQGHGPAVLAGYQRAVEVAPWVFQVDSDDEIPAGAFLDLWAQRSGTDAVLGVRVGRDQHPARRLMTSIARRVVRLTLGARVTDANCPFRLMRSAALAPILAQIPPNTFAPNIIISAALATGGGKVEERPVPHQVRAAGAGSLSGWKALRPAATAFRQTVAITRAMK